MKIVDSTGTVITNPDLTKGYLIQDFETVHHNAVEEIKKVSHYETLKEYPNGGRDVQEVIDVEPVAAAAAYDEKVEIQRYVLYTADELAAIEAKKNEPTMEQRLAAMEDAMMAMMGVSTNA